METKSNKNWWFLAFNGLFSILFGLMLIIFTKEVIRNIVIFIGLAIAVLGLILLVISISQLKKDKSVGAMILLSIFSLVIGAGIMIFRETTLNLFFILMGVWAVILGIFQLVVLVNIKRNLSNKNVILFNGLLTIALGIVMFFNPGEFSNFLFKIVGVFAVLFGIVMIYLSFVIRKASMIASEEPHDLPPVD
jgi:uncharacterized membrane protein HdeD (DUF308 family)